MKEVCEKTGLTDRAVRLYIDSGLLQPTEENNYSGRKSIHFSENDVYILEAIATLRKAGFSIPDIREMQVAPQHSHTIIDAHKQKLDTDIKNKLQILQNLSNINYNKPMNYTEIADLLRQSTSRNNLPKEDSRMLFKDFQQTIKNRFFSVIAFALLLVGLVTITPLLLQTAFADTEIVSGGGYNYVYTFTWKRLFQNIQLLGAGFCMLISTILMFIHIVYGKKELLISGCLFCILSVATLLLLPDEIRENLYRYEFLSYRQSFMWHILYATSQKFDLFIKTLKFIPPSTAAILSGVGIIRHKNIPAEEMQ